MTGTDESAPPADGGRAETAPQTRSTKQRRAIDAALAGFDDFRSAQDIHSAMREQGDNVGLATVYRGVQTLVEAGLVDMVKTDSGESLYRRCSPTHHHHLVCRDCGRTIEVEGPAVETWAAAVSREHGFVDVSHTVELFGTCAECHADAVTS